MSHAVLKTAEEATGKLVTLVTVVRNNAVNIAENKNKDLIIIDGPPGIGCPVISSITGVDLVLIVTEPTLSAIHDLKRIIGLSNHFQIPVVVCINKYSINLENTKRIEHYCKSNNIGIVGKIPYDKSFIEAMINEKSIVEFSDGEVSKKIIDMWSSIKERLFV